jgi:hypothetical protein
VTAIGIHLDNEVETVADGKLEPMNVGLRQAEFAWSSFEKQPTL